MRKVCSAKVCATYARCNLITCATMTAPTTNFETMEQRIKIKKKIRLISRIMHVFQNSNQFDYSNFAIAQKTSYTKATFGE